MAPSLDAAAQPAEPQRTPAAEEAFRSAVDALREERFDDAASAFDTSYQLEPRAETACNLALTYDRWPGHEEAAIDAYLRCARDDRSGRFRDHALARASALRAQGAAAPAEDLPSPQIEEPAVDPPSGAAVDPPSGDRSSLREAALVGPRVLSATPPRRRVGWAVGAGVFLVAGATFLGIGIAHAGRGRRRVEDILERYPNRVIPDGDEEGWRDVQRVSDDARRARAFYIASGVSAAVAVAFTAIHFTVGTRRLALAPTFGGAYASATFELR